MNNDDSAGNEAVSDRGGRLALVASSERYYGASRDGGLYASESVLEPEQEALCRMLARIARRLHSGRSRGHLRIVK